jgi:hypothetical protein
LQPPPVEVKPQATLSRVLGFRAWINAVNSAVFL